MIYVVRHRAGDDVYVVGYMSLSMDTEDVFVAMREFASEKQAYAFINYLNGGEGDFFQ
jgi:hypothetical protein